MPFQESKQELLSVLRQMNPWWAGGAPPELPSWRRPAFHELLEWMVDPPAPRAVLLSGARQVGKTTLLLQAIQALLARAVAPERIVYLSFDHPLLKVLGLEQVLRVWRERMPRTGEVEYFLVDEIQYAAHWQVWLKHQVDFEKRRRIAVTGSSVTLATERVESGVGRWSTIKLPTLSFYEYLQIRQVPVPRIPTVNSLADLFDWKDSDFLRVGGSAELLVGHFHEYLLRGGFPQSILAKSIALAQKLIRDDIVDKILKRDMTALFGVRRVLDLEKVFLYLCMHDGGILDISALCRNLELKRGTVESFIDLFEASHLIYRLARHGFGKNVLQPRYKVYLADPAIAGSVLLKDSTLLEDETKLGAAVETAFFRHVYARYYARSFGFYYWRGKQDVEVDILADTPNGIIPFEVKYKRGPVRPKDVKGLYAFFGERESVRAYVITRDVLDFGLMSKEPTRATKRIQDGPTILKIPAPLACYWLSQSEARSHESPEEQAD